MRPVNLKSLRPPSETARDFVLRMRWFGVGVAIALSPMLGAVNVPGFKGLLNAMPLQIRTELVFFSGFLMGLAALIVEFYAAERMSTRAIARGFLLAAIAMVVGFFLFYYLRGQFTVGVPRGSGRVSVLISSSPRASGPGGPCKCKDPEGQPTECIRDLSFDEAAIETCWGRRELQRRGSILGMSYLTLMGGFAGLVGLLVIRDAQRRRTRKSAQKKRQDKQQNKQQKKGTRPVRPAGSDGS